MDKSPWSDHDLGTTVHDCARFQLVARSSDEHTAFLFGERARDGGLGTGTHHTENCKPAEPGN